MLDNNANIKQQGFSNEHSYSMSKYVFLSICCYTDLEIYYYIILHYISLHMYSLYFKHKTLGRCFLPDMKFILAFKIVRLTILRTAIYCNKVKEIEI